MCLESWEDYGDLPNDPKGIHALLDRQCPKDMARQRACLTEWLPSGGCSKPDMLGTLGADSWIIQLLDFLSWKGLCG